MNIEIMKANFFSFLFLDTLERRTWCYYKNVVYIQKKIVIVLFCEPGIWLLSEKQNIVSVVLEGKKNVIAKKRPRKT